MSTVAAVDCGTNTVKLLVLRDGEELARASRVVRLGQGVDRTGRLSADALARTFAALEEYADLLAPLGVERIRFCATSATRDAANAEEFADGVETRLGTRPEVLSGAEEAALAYAGAVRGRTPDEPVLVVDVGGGSTELVLGAGEEVLAAHSMDIGSVRLTERHLAGDPPSEAEVAACVADVEAALDACPVDAGAAASVVGIAGTVTTLAAGVLRLPAYDPAAIDGVTLAVADVVGHVGELVTMTVEERKALPWMHPGRADVIAGGALVVERVLRRARVDRLEVSEADILEGIAWSVL